MSPRRLHCTIFSLIFLCALACNGYAASVEHPRCCYRSQNSEWFQIYEQKGTRAAESFLKRQLRREGTVYGGSLRGRATSLDSLACLYDWLGRYDDLAFVYSQIKKDEDVELVHGSDVGAVDAMCALAGLQCRQGQYEAAENTLRDAMDWYYCVGEPELRNAPFEKIVERTIWLAPFEDTCAVALVLSLCETWRARGKLSEADDLLKKSLSRFASPDAKSVPAVRSKQASLLRAQAALFEQQNLWTEASNACRQAILINEENVVADKNNFGRDLVNLARIHCRNKQFEIAFKTVDRALKFDESTFGKRNFRMARDLRAEAEILAQSGQEKEASATALRAFSIDQHTFGTKHLTCARDLALAKDPRSKEIYMFNLERAKEFLGPNDPHVAAISEELNQGIPQ